MEHMEEWLQKRIEKLKAKKKKQGNEYPVDLESVKRIGYKITAFNEVLAYIKTHSTKQ